MSRENAVIDWMVEDINQFGMIGNRRLSDVRNNNDSIFGEQVFKDVYELNGYSLSVSLQMAPPSTYAFPPLDPLAEDNTRGIYVNLIGSSCDATSASASDFTACPTEVENTTNYAKFNSSSINAISASVADTPNELVEDFQQGGIGDCWYLASIKSLSISTLGQQLFGNVINIDADSASVTFQGTPGYTYEIFLSDLAEEVNDGDNYSADGHSSGDADVLLLEMALKAYTSSVHTNFGSIYTGGSMNEALSLITGKECGYYSNSTGDVTVATVELDELAQVIDHTAITASADIANPSLGIPANNHAYSIVGIDAVNQTVSFRNPWYSGTVLQQLSYANFAYYFRSMAYVDLTTNNKCLYAQDADGTLSGDDGSDTLWGGLGKNTLYGNAGNDDLRGDNNADHLYGGEGDDWLTGWGGNDVLDGGAGNDTLYGKTGDDTYYVTAGDFVYEGANEGMDTVMANISYFLRSNIENLILMGTSNLNGEANELNNHLTGNSGANVLTGLAGNDTLDGGAGADTMTGGDGSDSYYVDNTGDVVTETNATVGAGGTDLVNSYLTAYTLGANVENGRILSTGSANLTGNSLGNVLYAGAGNNVLNGGTGTDTADYRYAGSAVILSLAVSNAQTTGGSGSDTLIGIENLTGSNYNDKLTGNPGSNVLNGRGGADTMTGGDGSDTYYVDNSGDIVTETNATAGTGGTDLVNSYLNVYTLGANVENGRILSTGSANLIGNSLGNILYGGSGSNVLNGGAGTDTADYRYAGSAVTASLAVTTAQTTGGSGSDTLLGIESLTGSSYNDKLTGNAGGNILNGLGGADTMIGGDGSDTYCVDNTGDVVTETNATASTGGTDHVHSYLAAYTLGANVENGRILATGSANLTGNSLGNVLYAGSGNNVLSGGTGTDTADYRYAGSAVTTSLAVTIAQVTGGSGSDTLLSIENLTGSSYNDTLIGNAAGNVLNGGAGNDTLTGGLGNDTFIFNSILNASTNLDVIADFSAVDDTVQFDQTIFTKLTTLGTLNASYFKASTTGLAAESDDYLLYNTATGALLYDADGSGAGVATQFAFLTTKPAISAVDCMVIA